MSKRGRSGKNNPIGFDLKDYRDQGSSVGGSCSQEKGKMSQW